MDKYHKCTTEPKQPEYDSIYMKFKNRQFKAWWVRGVVTGGALRAASGVLVMQVCLHQEKF